jgi:hypothetical protein
MKCFNFTVFLLVCLSAPAQEKDQTVNELPPAVQKTVDRETRGGEILKKGKEGKKYEISFVKMGMTKRIAVDENGVVTEYKDEVLLETLPAPAKAAIEVDAVGGELVGVSRYVRGKDVIYRSSVMKNGKKVGIQVAPDGTPIQEREGRRTQPK